MQTLPLLILLQSSTQTRLHPSIVCTLSGVVESTYVSNKHIKSCLYIEISAFNCRNKTTSQIAPTAFEHY